MYVANTLGAIAGSLAAGFLLVPRFGLHATFVGTSRVAIVGAVGVGGWAALKDRVGSTSRRLLFVGGVVAAGLLAAVLIDAPAWDRELLSSGAYKYAPYIHALDTGGCRNHFDIQAMLVEDAGFARDPRGAHDRR